MDHPAFQLGNVPANLSIPESREALLLYDPSCYKDGLDSARALKASSFVAFLGPAPVAKPWLREWTLEMEAVRMKAATELGKELADKLWAESSAGRKLGDDDRNTGAARHTVVKKMAYW